MHRRALSLVNGLMLVPCSYFWLAGSASRANGFSPEDLGVGYMLLTLLRGY